MLGNFFQDNASILQNTKSVRSVRTTNHCISHSTYKLNFHYWSQKLCFGKNITRLDVISVKVILHVGWLCTRLGVHVNLHQLKQFWVQFNMHKWTSLPGTVMPWTETHAEKHSLAYFQRFVDGMTHQILVFEVFDFFHQTNNLFLPWWDLFYQMEILLEFGLILENKRKYLEFHFSLIWHKEKLRHHCL